jgi:2-polyprenyl-3-methyl-5-hydroxy-6-metoxy-1,4-benzoquinol methylase
LQHVRRALGKRLNQRQGLFPKDKVGITKTVAKCDRCHLIYVNPMPVPQRLEDHYGIEPEQYWTENSYFEQDQNYFLPQLRRYQELSESIPGRQPGARALDIGGGIGKTMLAMSREGFDVYGVEASPSFYRAAIERMNISPDNLQLAMVEDAEFDPRSFDFINLGAVLEHLYDPAGVLERSIPWLKPNGLMHIEVPSSSYLMSTLVRWFYRLAGSDYVINTCPMHAPFHLVSNCTVRGTVTA